MSISDSLTLLSNTKTAIKNAIVSKGVSVSDSTPFSSYATAISNITSGGSSGGTNEHYARPSDWLALPTSFSSEAVVGLVAICDNSTYVCMRFTTSYGNGVIVDWGDGTSSVVADGTKIEHCYTFSSYDTECKTVCTRGYKQAIVKVTPMGGNGKLTNIDLSGTPSVVTTGVTYIFSWLDVIINANPDSLIFNGQALSMEQITFKQDLTNITDFSYFFQECCALQNIIGLATPNGTDFRYMFYDCYSLSYVPYFDTSKGTIFKKMFAYCNALKEIPSFDVSNGTDFSNMFNNCSCLIEVPLLETSNGTLFYNMFDGCYSLRYITQLKLPKATDVSSMFDNCPSLSTAYIYNIPISISLANCFMNNIMLNFIIMNLPTVTISQTLDIRGNYGVSTVPAYTISQAALVKNWVVKTS